MRLTLTLLGLLVIALIASARPAAAEEPDTTQRPQVMLLGSFHLANNNRDMINLRIDDVLVAKRQAEIEQLVENLARWKPTKILLEWDRSDQAGLDRRYRKYLGGELTLTANERDQIGLRLARRLAHRQVYAVDWNESAPGDPAAYDFFAWANENGAGDRLNALISQGQAAADRQSQRMRNQTVVEWYHDLNAPESLLENHREYFEIASFGDNDRNPGAAWVGGWYARNLMIFNNIREHVAPDERVLVIYGSGHIYHLDRFVRESDTAVVIEVRRYIEAP